MLHHHSQHYADRRHKVFERIQDKAACLLPASAKVNRNGDSDYPFRQNSHLYYLTGWPEDKTVLLLLAKEGHRKTILFCHESDELEARWVGKRVGLEEARKTYGADEAYFIDEIESMLPDLLLGVEKVYYPIGENAWMDTLVKKSVQVLKKWKRRGIHAPQAHMDVNGILDELRLVKMGDEIARMRKAASISAKAHNRAMRHVHGGMFEYELEAEYRYEFLRHGAHDVAYTPIVASGSNACILHYIQNNRKMNDGELILVDAACEYQGYAADITRTFPVNGQFTKPQQAIYELVLEAQLAAIAKATPVHAWNAMQETILQIMVQGLVDLKILKGDVGELIETGAYRPFYMHQSGHWLGLDVHDAGEYKIDDQWRTLKPGMVLTVEPGLYFPLEESSVPEAYRGIGVRIEDDILVTDNSPDVLSAESVKSVQDIEKIMKK